TRPRSAPGTCPRASTPVRPAIVTPTAAARASPVPARSAVPAVDRVGPRPRTLTDIRVARRVFPPTTPPQATTRTRRVRAVRVPEGHVQPVHVLAAMHAPRARVPVAVAATAARAAATAETRPTARWN